MNTGMRQGLVRFFSAPPMPCPYLPGMLERQVVTMLSGADDPNNLHTLLSQSGFRRSYNIAYKPACDKCTACTPVRVLCQDFSMSKNQKRVWRRAPKMTAQVLPPKATEEHFDLFELYQHQRHRDGSMSEMTFTDYADMVQETPVDTRLVEFRLADGRLAGVCLTDHMEDGLSMVYSFYDPELEPFSPGTYFILWHILHTASQGLPYLYLGYWIKQSRKMAYKSRFKPMEQLRGDEWSPLMESF